MKNPCPSLHIRRLACLLVAAACLAAPLAASASGSYRTSVPNPPRAKAGKVDRDQYDLGQKVFNGKTAPAQGEAVAQRARLAALQSQLPEKVARKKDLTALAGKLTGPQLDALEYYVKERYPGSK